MFCIKCDNDLAECICPDLKERFELISNAEHLYIGPDYKKMIEAQIIKNQEKKTT